jgi:hypothetical protein
MSFSHNDKDRLNESEWHSRVKKIAHRINKDFSRLIPPQRLVKYIWL